MRLLVANLSNWWVKIASPDALDAASHSTSWHAVNTKPQKTEGESHEYHFGDWRGRQLSPLSCCGTTFPPTGRRVLQCAERLNVVLMKAPPGYASVCKPADRSWNWPLKERLRQCRTEQPHRQLDNHDKAGGNVKPTPPSRSDVVTGHTRVTQHDVVKWVAELWESLSVSTIETGFNAISAEEPVDADAQWRYNYLASRLEELQLLDSEIEEVTLDHGVVEITLSCFE